MPYSGLHLRPLAVSYKYVPLCNSDYESYGGKGAYWNFSGDFQELLSIDNQKQFYIVTNFLTKKIFVSVIWFTKAFRKRKKMYHCYSERPM